MSIIEGENINSILGSLVHAGDKPMAYRQIGDCAYLMTQWEADRPINYIPVDRLEKAIVSFLDDWESDAGHLCSYEELIAAIKAANSELRQKIREEIARRILRIDVEFEDEIPTQAVISLATGWKDFVLFQK
jgi:hypothetical protein